MTMIRIERNRKANLSAYAGHVFFAACYRERRLG